MMKRGVIAVVVVCAGASGLYAMLHNRGGLDVAEPVEKTTTLAINLKKPVIDTRIPSIAVTKTTDKSDRVTMLETASIPKPVVTPVIAPASADFLSGVAALAGRDSATAIRYRDSLEKNSVEWQTLGWAIAVSGQSSVPASMIAETMMSLNTWPAGNDLQANLERALYRENPSANLVMTTLASRKLVTPEGALILARAAMETGDQARARRVIQTLWHENVMDTGLEDATLAEFGSLLTPVDDDQRMRTLLFKERFDQAKRFATRAGAIPLHDLFVAVARKKSNASKLIKASDAKMRADPTFIYLLTKHLRQAKRYKDAAKVLAKTPKDDAQLVDPGAWWVEARIVSRGLMDQGLVKDAYALAAAHVARQASDIAEAEFHAGWFALRGLKDPAKAFNHFNTLLVSSTRAQDQARAYYWLGRTAEAGGPGKADDYFAKASDFPATYYGQLSAARRGKQIEPGGRYRSTPEQEAAFAARPEIIGISLLEQAGEDSRARRLALALAARLTSPVELQMLAADALAKHGSTLALAIGKAALKQGHDPGLAAFPLGAIPETADISRSGKALAYAIARQESAFNPTAVSPADARGLLQILPSTARKVAQRYQLAWAEDRLLNDPAYNATLGSHYLGDQIDKFGGSYILTFAAYNAGPNRIPAWIKRYGDPRGRDVDAAVDWVENIPFQETRDYVQRVMENYQIYKMLLKEKTDIAADLTIGRRIQ